MEFSFPKYREQYQSISDLSQLREKLNQQSKWISNKIRYKFNLHKNSYIYAICRECSSSLRYKFDEQAQIYRLSYFLNQHQHKLKFKYHNVILKTFIKDLPDQMDLAAAKHCTLSHFNIKPSKFYYYFSKLKNPQISFSSLITELDSNGFQIQMDPYSIHLDKKPETLLIIAPYMKDNFKKYGQWCSVDVTFNLFNQRSENGKQLKLGFILGVNFSLKIVPFALIIIAEQSKQNYYNLLKAFCQAMPTHPQIIVSDQSASIKASINALKQHNIFLGYHLLDLYHILKNVKKKLQNKEALKTFSEISQASNLNQMQKLVQQAYRQLSFRDCQVLEDFIRNGEKYCYPLLPNQILGFYISDGINEKLNDMIKSKIKISKPYAIVIRQSLKLLQRVQNNSQTQAILERLPFERYYGWGYLKEARYYLEKRVFNYLIGQFSRTLHCNIKSSSEQIILIQDLRNDYNFRVQYLGEDIWRCQCGWSIRSGLICSHEIKIYLSFNKSFLHQIHQRWKCQNIKINKRPKIISRKTRRNILR